MGHDDVEPFQDNVKFFGGIFGQWCRMVELMSDHRVEESDERAHAILKEVVEAASRKIWRSNGRRKLGYCSTHEGVQVAITGNHCRTEMGDNLAHLRRHMRDFIRSTRDRAAHHFKLLAHGCIGDNIWNSIATLAKRAGSSGYMGKLQI